MDLAVNYGGEGFLILFPNTTGAAQTASLGIASEMAGSLDLAKHEGRNRVCADDGALAG